MFSPPHECRDKLGRRVYVFRPGRWDPSKVSHLLHPEASSPPISQISFNDLFCAGYMLSELVVREERTQVK